ncbi:MAG: IS21-like element helper ATPase IstB [Prevotella sp.]|nr:IS21-like element helper ATPase IstB [Candidatus Prevotella equi]
METNNTTTQSGKDMNATTLDLMGRMRLNGMKEAFKASLGSTFAENMTPDAFVASLISSEWDYRNDKMVARLTKQAAFRYKAYLEAVDYTLPRGLNQNQMERLATLDFIREHQNVIITGPSGTGKSFIACGLGHEACNNGFRTYYSNTQKLMNKLKGAKAKGTYEQEMKKIEKTQLLILDDLFLIGLDAKERAILMDIVEDRHGQKSMILTAQIPVGNWYEAIGDPTIADAILDRIVHTAHQIELNGDSLRKMGLQ